MTCKRRLLTACLLAASACALGCKAKKTNSSTEDGGGSSMDAGDKAPRTSSGASNSGQAGKGGGANAGMDAGMDATPGHRPAGNGTSTDAGAGSNTMTAHDAATPGNTLPDAAAAHEDAGADEDGGSTHAPDPIAIAGRWHSSYGGTEVIDSHGFTSWGSTSAIIEYDNTKRSLITQSPPDDPYSANKFNRIVWTPLQSGSFYYCVVDYGLDTANAARNSTTVADPSSPDTTGCDGFPWTKLSPVIAVEGAWTDGVTPFSIDSDNWGSAAITSYTTTSAITQNAASDPTNPSLFNKVVWTAVMARSFELCFVSKNESSAADAENHASTANPSDLATGCGGGAWTRIDAQ